MNKLAEIGIIKNAARANRCWSQLFSCIEREATDAKPFPQEVAFLGFVQIFGSSWVFLKFIPFGSEDCS